MNEIRYEYARVSTKEQNEDKQILELKEFPICEDDKISRKDF